MTTTALRYSVDIDFPKVNWKIVCFASFSVCAALLLYYVWQVNHLTQGTYMISNYEKQISQLSEEKKNLEVGFAESGFLSGVQQKIRALNFQKTASVKYIQIPANALAKAK